MTVLDGIKALAKDAIWSRYARGCDIRNPSTDGFGAAIRLAQEADCVILVLGGSSARDFGTQADENRTVIATMIRDGLREGRDVGPWALGGSGKLAQKLSRPGTPVAVVLIEAAARVTCWRALRLLPHGIRNEPAQRIAEILFGAVNPSGNSRCRLRIPTDSSVITTAIQ